VSRRSMARLDCCYRRYTDVVKVEVACRVVNCGQKSGSDVLGRMDHDNIFLHI
jgi:hypothetical protein